ncbi:MAG: DUF2490 domain-containing protein [Bacteroidota bacterium]
MKRLLALPLILAFLTFAQTAAGQQDDMCLWSKFTIEKALSARYSVYVTQESRLRENISRPDELYLEGGGSMKAGYGLKLSMGYRFSGNFDDVKYYSLGMRYHHRGFLDLDYKVRRGQFTFNFRARLQAEFKNVYSSDKGKVPEWYWRDKFEVKYRIRRFEPYLGVEPHFQIIDPRNPEGNFSVNRLWIFAGVGYSVMKHHTVGIYYMVQREWKVPTPQNKYIIGIEYSISLPHGKKK